MSYVGPVSFTLVQKSKHNHTFPFQFHLHFLLHFSPHLTKPLSLSLFLPLGVLVPGASLALFIPSFLLDLNSLLSSFLTQTFVFPSDFLIPLIIICFAFQTTSSAIRGQAPKTSMFASCFITNVLTMLRHIHTYQNARFF